MISLDFSIAVALFVGTTSIGIFLFWFVWGQKQSQQFIPKQEEEIWQCSICVSLYSEKPNLTISICPRCGSYNKKTESGGNP